MALRPDDVGLLAPDVLDDVGHELDRPPPGLDRGHVVGLENLERVLSNDTTLRDDTEEVVTSVVQAPGKTFDAGLDTTVAQQGELLAVFVPYESNPHRKSHMNKYRIIFRTCDAVYSVHSLPRPFGLDKRRTIEICFASLLESVRGFPHEIHILGDRLSEETLRFFEKYDVEIINETLDNDRSIERSFELADSFPAEDWVYFCEDDYLHAPHAFEFIDEFIENREAILDTGPGTIDNCSLEKNLGSLPLFIHPPDYPDRYKPDQRRPSFLFLSHHCHWRQISNTTFTFLAQARTVARYRDELQRSVRGADDAYLSRAIYASESYAGRALCVSPIPGLTTHMHEGVMTPLVDWERGKSKRR